MPRDTIQRTVKFGPVYENKQKGVSQTGVKHSFAELHYDNGKLVTSILHTADNRDRAEEERSRIIAERGETFTITLSAAHGGPVEQQIAAKMAASAREAVEE